MCYNARHPHPYRSNPMPDSMTKPKRWRKRLVRGGVCVAGVAVLAWTAFYVWVWNYCVAWPPEVSPVPPIVGQEVVQSGEYLRIGQSYLAKKNGILRAKLVGDPYTRGYSIGRLAQPYIEVQEAEFVDAIREHVPNPAALWLLKVFVTVRNRDLPEYVRMEHQVELAGYVAGYEDKFASIGPAYHRKLNYHAAHDIGHALIDNPLVGCTSFAAWGDDTADGHLIVARTFDFDVARSFDTNKVVYSIQPEEGLSFMYVAWPGMMGVVSGLNEARISVTLNAGHSDDDRTIGTPVSLVARDVLQYASTLDEAVQIIRDSTMFVNESFLIADGKSGRALVVEKSPHRCEVREAEGQHIVCANHFLSPAFQQDANHIAYLEEGTSVVRFNRTQEWIDANKGRITPEAAVAFVRDRMVPGVDEPVVGNPAAINMLAATHAVVLDLTDGVMWVSAAPHQLGQFVPFGLDDFEAPPGKEIIPADPMLADGTYDRYLESQAHLESARGALDAGDLDIAFEDCQNALLLNQTDYHAYALLAEIEYARGNFDAAREHIQDARARHVAYGTERRALDELARAVDERQGRD